MIRLVRPSIKYKKSFLAAREELQKEGKIHDEDQWNVGDNFSRFVQRLRSYSRGLGLPKGYIPCTVYWLVDGTTCIGKVSIRHYLTPHLRRFGGHIGYVIRPSKRRRGYGTTILRLALLKAKKLEIKKVLVTCYATNIGSRKIIEKNGGVLENAVAQGRRHPKKLRFWVHL